MEQGFLFGEPKKTSQTNRATKKQKLKLKPLIPSLDEIVKSPEVKVVVPKRIPPFDSKTIERGLVSISKKSGLKYEYTIGNLMSEIHMSPHFNFHNFYIIFDVFTQRNEFVRNEFMNRSFLHNELYAVKLYYPNFEKPLTAHYTNDLGESLRNFEITISFAKKYPNPEKVPHLKNLIDRMKIRK